VEARFSAPVRNGPAGHTCFYIVDTRFLSRWERCRGLALTSHPPSSVEVKEKTGLYLYSISRPSWPFPRRTSFGHFPCPLISPCVVQSCSEGQVYIINPVAHYEHLYILYLFYEKGVIF